MGPQIEKKLAKLPAYHFYRNKERLTELLNKEIDYKYELATKKPGDQELSIAPLTDDEQDEKQQLLASGFAGWTRADYFAFIRGSEKNGRDSYTQIAEIVGKPEDSVREYSRVFWERIDELPEFERIVKNIEKGEAMIREEEEAMRLLKAKCVHTKYFDDLVFETTTYNKFRSKLYTEDHDKFILFYTANNGIGQWKGLKKAVECESAFEYDPYIRSRAEVDLSKRLTYVVKFLKAEEERMEVLHKELEKATKKEKTAKRERARSASLKSQKGGKKDKQTNRKNSTGRSKSTAKGKNKSTGKTKKLKPTDKKSKKYKTIDSRSVSKKKSKEGVDQLKKRAPSKQTSKPSKKTKK